MAETIHVYHFEEKDLYVPIDEESKQRLSALLRRRQMIFFRPGELAGLEVAAEARGWTVQVAEEPGQAPPSYFWSNM